MFIIYKKEFMSQHIGIIPYPFSRIHSDLKSFVAKYNGF